LPANVPPVLTITRFGRTERYTILGGVRDLATAGLWPRALLVFFASILVPVLELVLDRDPVALDAAATAVHCTLPPDRLRRAVVEHRRVHDLDLDRVGAVAVRVPTTVDRGPGIASFAAVVALTMIATPRLRLAPDVGCGSGGTALNHSDPSGPVPDNSPTPVTSGWAGLPWVWEVSIVTAIIADWLGYCALIERGPTIIIDFATADRVGA
jgi:hypothetical protein